MDYFSLDRAAPADAPLLGELYVQAWRAAYRHLVPARYLHGLSPRAMTPKVRENMRPGHDFTYYLARVDGEPAGLLALQPCAEEERARDVGSIYLLPRHWGRGYGRRMMDRAACEIKDRGYSTLSLWVLRDNTRARAFYEAYGLRPTGEEKMIEIAGPFPALRYRMTL